MVKKKTKRQTNKKCDCFIKNKLARLYTEDKLANEQLAEGERKYLSNLQDKSVTEKYK